jgi:hypothetical protein
MYGETLSGLPFTVPHSSCVWFDEYFFDLLFIQNVSCSMVFNQLYYNLAIRFCITFLPHKLVYFLIYYENHKMLTYYFSLFHIYETYLTCLPTYLLWRNTLQCIHETECEISPQCYPLCFVLNLTLILYFLYFFAFYYYLFIFYFTFFLTLNLKNCSFSHI